MLRNSALAWLVAFVAIIVAVVFATRAHQAQKRADTVEARVDAKEQLERAAANLQSVRFMRTDEVSGTITYGVPEESKVGDQTFINYVERTSSLSVGAQILGLPIGGAITLGAVPAGTPMSIRTSTGDDGSVTIEAVYFLH